MLMRVGHFSDLTLQKQECVSKSVNVTDVVDASSAFWVTLWDKHESYAFFGKPILALWD